MVFEVSLRFAIFSPLNLLQDQSLTTVVKCDQNPGIVILDSSKISFNSGQKNIPNWKCLKVTGPLDFNLTGILNGLSDTLAQAKISIFYDFDI